MIQETVPGDADPDPEIRGVVETVRILGDRARFLAVNLAVATAKLKQLQSGGARLNEDLLDLVARVSRVSHDVGDAVEAMEKGLPRIRPRSREMWSTLEPAGVPNEQTLERLNRTLSETVDLAQQVFHWVAELEGTDKPKAKSGSG